MLLVEEISQLLNEQVDRNASFVKFPDPTYEAFKLRICLIKEGWNREELMDKWDRDMYNHLINTGYEPSVKLKKSILLQGKQLTRSKTI